MENKIQNSLIQKNNKKYCLQLWLQISTVDNKFSKLFKKYLGIDAVYNFITSMIEESKYCSHRLYEKTF